MIIQIYYILPLRCDFVNHLKWFREIENESVLNIIKLIKNKDLNSEINMWRSTTPPIITSSGFIDINVAYLLIPFSLERFSLFLSRQMVRIMRGLCSEQEY